MLVEKELNTFSSIGAALLEVVRDNAARNERYEADAAPDGA